MNDSTRYPWPPAPAPSIITTTPIPVPGPDDELGMLETLAQAVEFFTGWWSLLLYALAAVVVLALTTFLVVTVYIGYVHWKHSHIPSPPRQSFYFGHAQDIIEARKRSGNDELPLTGIVHQWYVDAGSEVFVIFFVWRVMVLTVNPDDVKYVILQSKINKASVIVSMFKDIFGERFIDKGVLNIPDYETWKPRRQLYDPAFNKSYLKGLVPAFNECVDHLIDKLEQHASGGLPIPMKEQFASVTLEVISKVAFASDFSEKWCTDNLDLKSANGRWNLIFIVDSTFKGLQKEINTLFPSLYKVLHPSEVRGYTESVRAIRKIGRHCILERIETIKSGEQPPNDILSRIIQTSVLNDTVDLEQLVDDFTTFYVAGQETTSNLLSFALIMVLQHPDVLERLLDEVDEVLDGKDTASADDVEKLQYTEQVLTETLRLHPVVTVVSKEACKGGTMLSGHLIPEGTHIVLDTAVMCRLPEYFQDPENFDPSRFDPGNKKPSSFVFFPFGIGHRSCIGRHFALMEAKIVLARLLKRFTFTLPSNYEFVKAARATIQPKDGVMCTVQQRTLKD